MYVPVEEQHFFFFFMVDELCTTAFQLKACVKKDSVCLPCTEHQMSTPHEHKRTFRMKHAAGHADEQRNLILNPGSEFWLKPRIFMQSCRAAFGANSAGV